MSVLTQVIHHEHDKRLGFRLEDMIADRLLVLFGSDFRKANIHEDRIFGTDFYVQGVPIDVTAYAGRKDKMIHCGTVNVWDVFTIQVYARFGNRHHDFSYPVMVLEFDVPANREGNLMIQMWLEKESMYECMDSFFSAIEAYGF
jgi:hypothetical protein